MTNQLNNENILGESPLWDYKNKKYLWVDIEGKKIKSYDNYNIQTFNLDKSPTCLTLLDYNQIFCIVEDGLGIYDFRNESYNYLKKIDDKKVRFNDGKCDRNGILYVGTMCRMSPRYPIASLYKYENNMLIEKYTNIGTCNGISFSKDNQIMYFSDSSTKSIFYKSDNNTKQFYQDDNFAPDGSTVDINNKYYSCMFRGSHINIFKNFKLENTLLLNCQKPTCCCFGGENLDKLFVTSSFVDKNDNGSPIILSDIGIGIKETPIKL